MIRIRRGWGLIFLMASQVWAAAQSGHLTREIWVNPQAASGNGTREHPFKALSEALEIQGELLRIHLSEGEFVGPFEIRGNVSLEGAGDKTVLLAPQGAVVSNRGQLRLQNAVVKGGAVGISSEGALHVSRVMFLGQREWSVTVVGGGLRAEDCIFTPDSNSGGAIELAQGASASVENSRFTGVYARAIRARFPTELSVVKAEFDGPGIALHQVGGSASMEQLRVGRGSGPALFFAKARVQAKGLRVIGHEYALQVGAESQVAVEDFSSNAASLSAISLVQSKVDLRGVTLENTGTTGAVAMVGGRVIVSDFHIHGAQGYGINARQGALSLERGEISDVSDPSGGAGYGILLRASKAHLEDISVQRAAGHCVMTSEGTLAEAGALRLDGCGMVGLWVERDSRFQGRVLQVRKAVGSALTVPDRAFAKIQRLVSEQNGGGPYWAGCNQGAHVQLGGLQSDVSPRDLPCVVR